jgi:hypothetical protein
MIHPRTQERPALRSRSSTSASTSASSQLVPYNPQDLSAAPLSSLLEAGEAALRVQEALGHVAASRVHASSSQEAGYTYPLHNKRAYNKSQRGELSPHALITAQRGLAVVSVHKHTACSRFRGASDVLVASTGGASAAVCTAVNGAAPLPPARRPHSNGLHAAHIYHSRWWRGHSPCLSSPATLGWSGLNRLAGDLDEQVRTLAASYDRTYDRISMTGTMTGPMTGGLWQAIYDRTYDRTYDRWPCRAPAVAAGASGRGRVLVARPFCTPSPSRALACAMHVHILTTAPAPHARAQAIGGDHRPMHPPLAPHPAPAAAVPFSAAAFALACHAERMHACCSHVHGTTR